MKFIEYKPGTMVFEINNKLNNGKPMKILNCVKMQLTLELLNGEIITINLADYNIILMNSDISGKLPSPN